MKPNSTYSWFRRIAFAEGISFLVLLFIGMPLKYWAGKPLVVLIGGYAHGFLFIAFLVMAFMVKFEYNRSWGWGVRAFLASVIPFGTLLMEKQWRKEEAAVTV